MEIRLCDIYIAQIKEGNIFVVEFNGMFYDILNNKMHKNVFDIRPVSRSFSDKIDVFNFIGSKNYEELEKYIDNFIKSVIINKNYYLKNLEIGIIGKGNVKTNNNIENITGVSKSLGIKINKNEVYDLVSEKVITYFDKTTKIKDKLYFMSLNKVFPNSNGKVSISDFDGILDKYRDPNISYNISDEEVKSLIKNLKKPK